MKKCSALALIALAASISLTSCAGQASSTENVTVHDTTQSDTVEPKDNTDPRKGWVVVVDMTGYPYASAPYKDITLLKRCDGDTLLYVTPGYRSGAHGITAVDLSPECRAQS
jgi:hypothetical protein